MMRFLTVLLFLAAPIFASLKSLPELEKELGAMVKTIQQTRWEETTEIFRDNIAAKSETRLREISENQKQLLIALNSLLGELRTSEQEQVKLLELFRTGGTDHPYFPTTLTLLRAHALQNNPSSMLSLLQILLTSVKLIHYQLIFSHALTLSYSLPHLPIALFQTDILATLHARLGMLELLFPTFPQLTYGNLRNAAGIDETRLKAALSRFVVGFSPQESANVPAEGNDNLKRAILIIENSVHDIEAYYLSFYPQAYRSEALAHLSSQIMKVKGLRECVNLTRGLSEFSGNIPTLLSDFEGEACSFEDFRRAILNYVSFYRASEAGTLLPVLRDFFLTAPDNFPNSPIPEMRTTLAKLVLEDASPALRTQWPAIETEVFRDTERVNRWTQGDTLTLDRDLKNILKQSGINPFAGFDVNYCENINQAENLLKNLEKIGSTPIVSVDSQTACKPFLDGASDFSRVVQTMREARIDPKAEISSDGYSRLVRLYEVRIGDLLSIQNTEPVHVTLAGLLQSTVLSQLTANAVQTQILAGINPSQTPEELGIRIPKQTYLHPVQAIYGFSNASTTMAQAAAAGNDTITPDFREKYRKEMLITAQKIRQLDARIKLLETRGEAARMAPPGLAHILNIPTFFTGETDLNVSAPINHALIDLVGYVRLDYVKRKNSGKKAQEIEQINIATRLTIDQFKEQIDWYSGVEGGQIVGPPRFTNFIGREELGILQKHPVIQGFLLTHVNDALDGPRDFAKWTKEVLIARFPMFRRIEGASVTEVWRTYQDSDFEKTLESHLAMIVATANEFLRHEDLNSLFDQAIPNSSLVDQILRRHPDQKRSVCLEQQRIDERRTRRKKVVMGLNTAALGLSLIPYFGPEAAFIPGAISVWMTADDALAARRILAQASAYQVASFSQRLGAETDRDTAHLRRLEDQYFNALFDTATSIASLATSGAIRFSRFKLIGGSFRNATKDFLGSWEHAIAKPWKLPLPASTLKHPALRLSMRLYDLTNRGLKTVGGLAYPLERLGVIANHTREWQLFSKLSPGVSRVKRIAIRAWHGIEDGTHLALNWPVIPFGAQIGTGTAVKYVGIYGLYELGNWSFHSWRAVKDSARQLTVSRLNAALHDSGPQPEYAELLNAVYQGSLTIDEAAQVLEMDKRYGYEEALNKVIQSIDETHPGIARQQLEEMANNLEMGLKNTNDPQHKLAMRRALFEIWRVAMPMPH